MRLFERVRGQGTAITTLQRALERGRVHHALLFDGPDGVGKELAAFALAQSLVCEAPERGLACGRCSACGRAAPRDGETRPVHPDVVVLERGLYEPAQIGRRTPETQDISIDQIRTLVLARAAFPPHEGRAKVFIVRRADELSISAANALLKTLEEPGPRSHFVLLTSQPGALLATIRSRTLRVRFGPLPDDVVGAILAERGMADAATVASLAGGSVAAALALGDPEQTAARERFVAAARAALSTPHLAPGLALAEDGKKNKEALAVGLGALAAALATDARGAAAAATREADVAAERFGLVTSALRHLDQNASPQLTTEALFIRLRQL